ncbi:hypothetical protein BALAC2494_00779 [Bifidobacterium animalis subsp. lactis CNCM I-2494]|uniref:Uncharacterized protein n=1 Tax=Bifidobacterium animalis subsp. lactis CNCM I-2494 TaxID=1042403 RepID=A0A806FMW0_BIFAN|nr:hypothetical protein BALAC2494_00779 [Bifidobacterium animalis subsp. lactis CNCM I-2494]
MIRAAWPHDTAFAAQAARGSRIDMRGPLFLPCSEKSSLNRSGRTVLFT